MKNVEKMEELLNPEMLLNPDFILKHASIRLVPSSKRPKEGDLFKDFGSNMLLKAGLAVNCTDDSVLWRAMNNEMMRCLPGEPEEKRRTFNEAAVNNLRKEAVVFPMGSDPFEMIAGINDHTQRIEFGNGCYPVIVTNRSGIYGAASVLAIAEQAEEQIGAFYMLPSSVHEVILLPESMGVSYEEAALMVQEVNSSEVGPEDFLSDTVYRYENDKFFIPVHKVQA